MSKLKKLHVDVGKKVADIELIFEKNGIPMPKITLFARQPGNDKMTFVLTTEENVADIRKSFEIVMGSSDEEVSVTEIEALAYLLNTTHAPPSLR